MSDVEKYGLFAVVFVGGVLLVIGLQGGFSSGDPAAAAGAPVVIGGDVPLSSPAVDAGQAPSRVRVKSIMPETPFVWSEPPIAYPGERSTASPARAEEPAAVAPAGAPVAVSTAPGLHAIAPGETLSDVARRYLGNESRWKDLVKWNPGLDPKRLQIGQQIRVTGVLPESASAAAPPSAGSAPAVTAPAAAGARSGSRTHTVVKGDTLGAIAKQYLGSSSKADELYAANKDLLKSKNDLAIGQVLRIP